MKRLLLLPIVVLLLTNCTGDRQARHAYDEAQHLLEQGDAPQALRYYRYAADHACSDSLRAAINSDMGHLLFDEGLQEEALSAFRLAYQTDSAQHDSLQMAADLCDIANVYRTREADDSCLVFFQQALELAKRDSLLTANINSQLAGYHLWHQQYAEARPLLLPAMTGNPSDAGLRFMAADLYCHTGPRDSALFYCLSLLNEEEVVHRQMGHRWLADLLLQEGRTEEAARHLQQYELLTDTLMEQTDTEALRHINTLYDYSRQVERNARLQHRIAVAIAAIAMLVCLLVAMLFYFSRRRMHYRLKVQQLEHLLAEHRNRDSQTTLRQQQILTETPIYRHIRRLLSDSTPRSMTDEDWHILSDTIEKIHPQFHKRLLEFHRLSPQEMRITLLLKAGIAPADIARLTAHSRQSVSSTRARLFQKVFGRKGSPSEWDEFVETL